MPDLNLDDIKAFLKEHPDAAKEISLFVEESTSPITDPERSSPGVIPVQNMGGLTCSDCGVKVFGIDALTSPESREVKFTYLKGYRAVESVVKIVCKECYRPAFKRVYPGVPCPI